MKAAPQQARTEGVAGETPVYQRIVLKLSGESLSGPDDFGIHAKQSRSIAREVKDVQDLGVEIAVIVGGGNIFRGARQQGLEIDRATGDYMGMLATVLNGLAHAGRARKGRVPHAADERDRDASGGRAVHPAPRDAAPGKEARGDLRGGTGNPYFSTDTAAALRAMEIKAQVILKATRVDGIYDADPEKVTSAKMFERITYLDVLQKGLSVMDSTAISLCMDNKMPIVVFNMNVPGNLKRVVVGERVGSTVTAA